MTWKGKKFHINFSKQCINSHKKSKTYCIFIYTVTLVIIIIIRNRAKTICLHKLRLGAITRYDCVGMPTQNVSQTNSHCHYPLQHVKKHLNINFHVNLSTLKFWRPSWIQNGRHRQILILVIEYYSQHHKLTVHQFSSKSDHF